MGNGASRFEFRWIALSLISFLTFLVTPSAYAQFSAQLSGTVTDATGAVIPNANVTLTDEATHVVRNAISTSAGSYSFQQLPPGSFTIEATAKGFKASTVSNVSVVAESHRDVDIKLEIGGAGETVTVNGDTAPALQTSDATISGTIDSQALQRVPAYGRDPYELLRTTPGITGDGARSGAGQGVFLPNGGGPGQSNSGIFQTENQIQISADGQRTADNNFLLDGVSVNSLGYGGAAVVTPNLEAVSQITVISTSYSAEDGRNSGAQIKTVTKSGTNQFHGGGVFTYDQPGLNAYNKYGGPLGQAPVRVGLQQRDWAASLGGPIVKNKLFFFLSYEGFTNENVTYPSQYIETPEYRQFIASDRPNTIANAIANAPGGIPRVLEILPATCSAPYNVGTPCNVVQGGLDLGSPFGATGVYVPLSQAQSGSGLDGVPDVTYAQLILPNKSRGNQFNARGDWYLSKQDQIFGTVFFTKLDNQSPSGATGARANQVVPFKPLNSAITFGYIRTLSTTFLNELRANSTRFSENGIVDAKGSVDYGIPYINIQNMNFDASNDLNFGVNQASTQPGIFAQNTYELRDTATKTLGTQTLKFGFEWRSEQNNNNLGGSSRPVYAFGGIWNFANDTPIFEGITANPDTGGPALTQRYLNDHYYGVFGQDDWKVSPTLTLNIGLRWEYFEPLYNKGFNINMPNLGPPGLELIDVSLTPRNHLWNSQYKNISPKFGFAYVPPDSGGKTVVRGGFALAYNRLNDALVSNATENGPGYFNYGICCGTAATDFGTPFAGGQIQYTLGATSSPFSYPANPALATGTLPNGLPANGLGIEVYGVAPVIKTPYSYLYSFEIQRELPKQFTLTAGYQGSTGRHYPRLVNQIFLYNNNVGGVETPFSNGGAYFAQTDSNQYYNALNVHLAERMNHGLTMNIVYTFSKAMDQISNGDAANANGNQTDPAHNDTELGPSDYDVRHRFTALAVWDLPGMKSGSWLARAVTNGWQINGIYTYHTGFPFTPVTYQLHGVPTLANAAVIGPVRPLAYYGGVEEGCSNSNFIHGVFPGNITSDPGVYPATSKYFNIVPPTGSNGTPPGIGRNSFRGPCYQDVDMSFAKRQQFETRGHVVSFLFQANMYNIFNELTLTPFTNGNANPGALIESSTFGRAQSANGGRVVEFLARFQF
jgi:outer membrane receptor protein involved in Fe transport